MTTSNEIASASGEWKSYIESLIPVGARLQEQMHDQVDPQLRQEMYRLIFATFTFEYLNYFIGDKNHPDFVPVPNMAFNLWAPSPDFFYCYAPIDGTGIYEISGYRGTVKCVDFSVTAGHLFPAGKKGDQGPTLANYDLDAFEVDEDGFFKVILSLERPAGHQGNWWKLDPKATHLFQRHISSNWLREVDGRFAIERLDTPAAKPRLSATDIEERMGKIAASAENMVQFALDWVERSYYKTGLQNKIVNHALSNAGGLTRQSYIEGMFDLEPDEALIYETTVPANCKFWNLQLADELWSSLDFVHRQTHFNDYLARLDSDGKFRAVIAASDPGVSNWLDTIGYKKGVIFGRWLGGDTEPVLQITKVKLVDVLKYLPPDTPRFTFEEREAQIRLRRNGAQRRRRW